MFLDFLAREGMLFSFLEGRQFNPNPGRGQSEEWLSVGRPRERIWVTERGRDFF
jgi:hypothetical protein